MTKDMTTGTYHLTIPMNFWDPNLLNYVSFS